MMKPIRIFAAAIATALSATSVDAESYTYICRVPSEHKSYPVKIDIDNATILTSTASGVRARERRKEGDLTVPYA
jgi:hypothetical protein